MNKIHFTQKETNFQLHFLEAPRIRIQKQTTPLNQLLALLNSKITMEELPILSNCGTNEH